MRHLMTTYSCHFVICTLAIMVLSFASVSTVAAQETKQDCDSTQEMEETKKYCDVSQEMFDKCIKNHKDEEGCSEYKGGNSGEMMVFGDAMPTHDKWVATFRYEFDPRQSQLTYKGDPEQVSHLVWAGGGWERLWAGFDKTMQECKGST